MENLTLSIDSFKSDHGSSSSQFQDGGHDVISHRKVLPPGECARSICPVPIQQHPSVTDSQYMYIRACFKQWQIQLLDGGM